MAKKGGGSKKGGGNPYRDARGRFASGPGGGGKKGSKSAGGAKKAKAANKKAYTPPALTSGKPNDPKVVRSLAAKKGAATKKAKKDATKAAKAATANKVAAKGQATKRTAGGNYQAKKKPGTLTPEIQDFFGGRKKALVAQARAGMTMGKRVEGRTGLNYSPVPRRSKAQSSKQQAEAKAATARNKRKAAAYKAAATRKRNAASAKK